MTSYPVVLTHLNECRCVVVGGGRVASRKAQALVDAGARPVVISPECVSELTALAKEDRVQIVPRAYRPEDLDHAFLVIVATSDADLNASVAVECHRRGLLVNVVDAPEACSFTAPSIIRRGDLMLAISTDGQAPAFARHVREMLESAIDERYGELLSILADLRPDILSSVPHDNQAALWKQLLGDRVSACLHAQGPGAARALARSMVDSYLTPPAVTDD